MFLELMSLGVISTVNMFTVRCGALQRWSSQLANESTRTAAESVVETNWQISMSMSQFANPE